MSFVNWPASLPQRLLTEGYSEALGNNVLRSQMDAGPAKMRRITTSAPESFRGLVRLTQAQWMTLRQFYYVTLACVLPFTWIHPTTELPVNLRFLSPPAGSDPGPNLIPVVLDLEVIP